MSDSAAPTTDPVAECAEPALEALDAAAEAPARRPRYRPSEAWALRWLGPPATAA
jgi:hypothetical protein